jgi:hypothetical protein
VVEFQSVFCNASFGAHIFDFLVAFDVYSSKKAVKPERIPSSRMPETKIRQHLSFFACPKNREFILLIFYEKLAFLQSWRRVLTVIEFKHIFYALYNDQNEEFKTRSVSKHTV